MRKRILVGFLLLLSLVSLGASKPPSQSQEKIKKMREELKRLEEISLERLKQTNPKAYEEKLRQRELSQKISEVVGSFRKGKLDEEAARKRLSPLVRQSLERRIQHLDAEIERAEKRLEYLKKAKRNPDFLVDQQVNFYLGKATLEDRFLSRF